MDDQGRPHVVPVGFRYDEKSGAIEVAGPHLARSKKFRDARRTGRVAIVIDDIGEGWLPAGVEIRGRAEIVPTGGRELHEDFDDEMIRLLPELVASWGLAERSAATPESAAP